MSFEHTEDAASAADDVEDAARYAELEAEDALIIYDRECHRAWVQSDGAVDLAENR